MSAGRPGKRFGWLSEEDQTPEDTRREDGPARPPVAATVPGAMAGLSGPPAPVPGTTGRRRRNRAKDPKALRNDPDRTMAGARIRKDVRRRVGQALADPGAVGEGTNYSLLVESLLVRWLEEVGYPLQKR